MAKNSSKFSWCSHHKSFKECLAIFQMYQTQQNFQIATHILKTDILTPLLWNKTYPKTLISISNHCLIKNSNELINPGI